MARRYSTPGFDYPYVDTKSSLRKCPGADDRSGQPNKEGSITKTSSTNETESTSEEEEVNTESENDETKNSEGRAIERKTDDTTDDEEDEIKPA